MLYLLFLLALAGICILVTAVLVFYVRKSCKYEDEETELNGHDILK